jgi:hypothetical protein
MWRLEKYGEHFRRMCAIGGLGKLDMDLPNIDRGLLVGRQRPDGLLSHKGGVAATRSGAIATAQPDSQFGVNLKIKIEH